MQHKLLVALTSCTVSVMAQTNLFVAADGSTPFTSVQSAIMAVPSGSNENPVIIHIKPGTYKELIYLQREKRFFKLVGDNPTNTILSFNLYAGITNAEGKPIGTFKTPSTTIDADDFTAENLTFENSAGPVGQALAIRVDGDRAAFRNCRFLGWQDTILLNRGRQYFKNCYVCGHVDFIFGAATALFEKCQIHCLRDGYLTAASTPVDVPFGFVFSNCKITGAPDAKTFLGRPWRIYASTIFLNTEMSEVVRPEGWNDWKKPDAHTTMRYAEFNSTGDGANPTNRPDWTQQLKKSDAQKITVEKVLGGTDGWDPDLTQSFSANRFNIEYGEAGGRKIFLHSNLAGGRWKTSRRAHRSRRRLDDGRSRERHRAGLRAGRDELHLVHDLLPACADEPLAGVLRGFADRHPLGESARGGIQGRSESHCPAWLFCGRASRDARGHTRQGTQIHFAIPAARKKIRRHRSEERR